MVDKPYSRQNHLAITSRNNQHAIVDSIEALMANVKFREILFVAMKETSRCIGLIHTSETFLNSSTSIPTTNATNFDRGPVFSKKARKELERQN